jgi:hypothetical protein
LEDPALRLRKVVGKFVLLLAGVWVMVLIASMVSATQPGSVDVPVFNWVMAVGPGFALLPGAYASVKLLRSQDADEIKSRSVMSAIYGAAGLIIGIVCFVALAQTQKGGV